MGGCCRHARGLDTPLREVVRRGHRANEKKTKRTREVRPPQPACQPTPPTRCGLGAKGTCCPPTPPSGPRRPPDHETTSLTLQLTPLSKGLAADPAAGPVADRPPSRPPEKRCGQTALACQRPPLPPQPPAPPLPPPAWTRVWESGNAPSSLQITILQVHGGRLASGPPGGFLAGSGPAPQRLLAVYSLHTTEAQSYRCIFPTLQIGPAGRGPLLAPATWTGAPPCIRPGPFFGPTRSRLGPTRIQFKMRNLWFRTPTGIRRRRHRRAALPKRSVPSVGCPFDPSRSPPPLHAAAAAAPLLPAPAPTCRPSAVGAQVGSGVFVDDAIRLRPA